MRALTGLLILLLAGCAQLAPRADELTILNELVAQAVAATGAPAIEQQRALDGAREAFRRDSVTVNRLRFAMLLATLPSPRGDIKAAYALLEPFLGEEGKSPYASFGALLAGQVADRLRLARESEQATSERQRLARAAQQREANLRDEFERSRHAAEEREAKLREQLEALTSIERGIVEREEKIRNRNIGR